MSDLEALAIESLEPYMCEDSLKNRNILKRNEIEYSIVRPGVIAVDREQLDALPSPGLDAPHDRDSGLGYATKGGINLAIRTILVDQDDPYSEFVDFMNLPQDYLEFHAKPWVISRINRIRRFQESGKKSDSASLLVPTRCKAIRADGQRCCSWSMPTPLSKDFCRAHIDPTALKSNEYTEERKQAVQERLMQLIEPAVAALEDIVLNGGAPQVRLAAAEKILDRTLGKPGTDLNVNVEVEHKVEDPAMLIRQRLEKLAGTLAPPAIESYDSGENEEEEIVEGEVVE